MPCYQICTVFWLSNDCLDADVSRNRWSFYVITCHFKKGKKPLLNEAAQLDFIGVERVLKHYSTTQNQDASFCVYVEKTASCLHSTRTKAGSTALVLISHQNGKTDWKSKEGTEQTLIYPHRTTNPFLCLTTHEHFHVLSTAFIIYQIIPWGSIQLAMKILEKYLKIFLSFKWPEGLWRGWLSWWKEQIYMSWSISLGKRRLMCRPTHSCMCWKKSLQRELCTCVQKAEQWAKKQTRRREEKRTENGSRCNKRLQVYSIMALKFNYCIFSRNYNALLYLIVVPDLAFTLRIIVLCSQYIQLSTSQLSKEEENKAYIVAFLRILLLWNKDYYITKCSPIHFLPQVGQEQGVLSKTPGFLLAPSAHIWHCAGTHDSPSRAVSRQSPGKKPYYFLQWQRFTALQDQNCPTPG